MLILRRFTNILLCFISSSYALRCTINCYYRLNLTTPFYVPDSCNQTAVAGRCEVDISVEHHSEELKVSLTSASSDYIMKDRLYVNLWLGMDGSITLSYSTLHECKDRDNCAREFSINKVSEILNRPLLNYKAIGAKLKPLLVAAASTENSDLVCFDSNENVRQCSIAIVAGQCEASDQITKKNSITRSCDNEIYSVGGYVRMYDSGDSASFKFTCNRSLCNGHMTMQAVKEIMFKYNVTKNIEGRLNNSLRLTFSLKLAMLVLASLFLS